MKTQIIQLDEHDDLISTRDKMSWSKAPRILLVWPVKARLLERTIDLLLIQRHAQSLGAQVGLVTNRPEIVDQARQLGIPCFRNAAQAQKQVWRRHGGRKKLSLALAARKPPASDLREHAKEIALFHRGTEINPWLRAGIFGLSVVCVILLGLIFWPTANIEVRPVRETQRLVLDLRASTDIPEANPSGGLPAYAISVVVQGSAEMRSSGFVSVPTEQARGEVVFSNLGDDALLIPAGTVVTTTQGPMLRYATQRDLRLNPGFGSKGTVVVMALTPGKGGNLEAEAIRAIEGAVGLKASVTNPEAISGGMDQRIPGPSQTEFEELREQLTASLRETAIGDLQRQLSSGERLLEPSVRPTEVVEETLEPALGQPGDFSRLSMQVQFSGIYILEKDLQTVCRTALEVNRIEGMVPEAKDIKVEFVTEPKVLPNGSLSWQASAERNLLIGINPAQAAALASGKTVEQAERALQTQYKLDAPAKIMLAPRWWFWMPLLPMRIEVVIK